jgi:hypothetical protein
MTRLRKQRHNGHGDQGSHTLPVLDCLTCGALLATIPVLPELCPYCGADPNCRPHSLECSHTPPSGVAASDFYPKQRRRA